MDEGLPTREPRFGQVVGGSVKVPFPSKDGRVVAICISRDTNPDAPQRVLVADRRELPREGGRVDRSQAGHAANMLVTQGGAVPIFMRETSTEWADCSHASHQLCEAC